MLRNANVVFLSLAFLAGVMCVQTWQQLPDWSWLPGLLITVCMTPCSRLRMPVFFLLGLFWTAYLAQTQLDHRLPDAYQGIDLVLIGQVADLPSVDSKTTRFLFEVERVLDRPELDGHLRHVRLSSYDSAVRYKPGETWRLTVRLKLPSGFANPYGFDYESWLFQQGIDATGYVRGTPNPERLSDPGSICLNCWRLAILSRLSLIAPDLDHMATIAALSIGDRSMMNPEQWYVLRQTGTSHLLAISGLHIGLIAGLIFWSVRGSILLIGRGRMSTKIWPALAALIASGGYAVLSGFAVPAQRAFVMVAVIMLALLTQRHVKIAHGMGLALLAVLILDPNSVLSAGFWLSFGAVGVLTWVLPGYLRPMTFIRGLLHAQWIIALGLAPLLLLFFHQVPLLMPVANLFAVPWVSFVVVPLALLGNVLLWIHDDLAYWALKSTDWCLDVLWQVLNALAEFDVNHWNLPAADPLSYVLAIVGVLWLTGPKGLANKIMAPCLFLPILFPLQETINHGDMRLTILDVGQGLSTVVETQHHVLVFDTGAKWSDRFNAADSVLIPYLQGRGMDGVDLLVVSHGDNDHAGGVQALGRALPIGKSLGSIPSRYPDINMQSCHKGQDWTWDGVKFEVIHPNADDHLSGNNASCVIQVSTQDRRALLTGDIEQVVESRLLTVMGDRLQSDILIAPHHGSLTSSSEAFVHAVKPEVVVFPVGYRNRFGFPKQQVLSRYQKLGARIYDSATHGATQIDLKTNEPMQIGAYRESSRRYYHR